MGKIFYLMGKSASGKDTLYRELQKRFPGLRTVTLYTTRPIRAGEKDGETYYFVGQKELEQIRESGKLIELRSYETVHGIWDYFTVDDGQFDLGGQDYLMIGTLESYGRMREYFGAEVMEPLYVEVEDGERLARALARERSQPEPRYAEMCRRFLADSRDFSEEELSRYGITERFSNLDLEDALRKISERIQGSITNLG